MRPKRVSLKLAMTSTTLRKTISRMRDQGASLAQIAYALREIGVPPPAGGAWTVKTVEKVLCGKIGPARGGHAPDHHRPGC
jgi:hypothetical protein